MLLRKVACFRQREQPGAIQVRKGLSVSTLGAVDLRSDKERIARSARKGVKA
jgi:hypothetical protein